MGIWMTVVHIKWVYFKENVLALCGDNNPASYIFSLVAIW